MDDGIAIALGRLEKAVDKVESKVDKVSDGMTALGLTVAEQGIRLGHVEKDVNEIRAEQASTALTADSRKFGMKEKLLVAVLTIIGSGAVSLLIEFLKT